MSETSTVGLNLGGDFAAEAERAAQAAIKLAAGFERAGESAAKLKTPPLADDSAKLKGVAREAESAAKSFDKLRAARTAASQKAGGLEGAEKEAFGWLNRVPSSLAQAPPTISGFQKLVQGIDKVFGPNAAGAFVKGAEGVVGIGEKYGGAIKGAGAVLSAGGAVVATAAVALAAAAALLVVAGIKIGAEAIKFGIEQTSIREKIQNAIGASGYEVGIKVAAQYGLDTDVAFQQVKGLLAAKFKEDEIPAIVRISVGIGELKGEEKAKGFIDKLEVQKTKGGKATEETVKGFAEVGIASDAVYKKLAETLDITVAQAQAKVKAGMLDTAVVLKAVQAAASDQFGPIADKVGKSVPSLLSRIKLAFSQLFTGFDLGPLKGALGNLATTLEGPGGKRLFEAVSRFGSTVIKTLFGPFEGPDGAKKLERFAEGAARIIDKLADAVHEAAPAVERLVELISALYGAEGQGEELPLSKGLKGLALVLGAPFFGGVEDAVKGIAMITDAIFGTDTASLVEKGFGIGANFVSSIGDGLMSRSLDAIGALVGKNLIASVKSSLGIASPSKAAMELMGHFGDGLVKGAANDNGAAEAGGAMADKVSGAASEGLGRGGGAAAGGRGEAINITINISGAGADAQAMGDTIAAIIRRELRSVAREGQERAA